MLSLLVVDDDRLFLDVICKALRAKGFVVDSALDGREALAKMKAAAPDLLVTDIFMQDIDGIALITAVMASFPSVRIIAMTGARLMLSLDILDMAAQLGARATLEKPFSVAELLERVADALEIAPPN